MQHKNSLEQLQEVAEVAEVAEVPTRNVTENDLRKPIVTQTDLRNPLKSFGGGSGGLTLSKERENPIGVLSQRDSESLPPVRPGTPIRLRDPSLFPDLAGRHGTVVAEPCETVGVVTVEWEGRAGISRHRAGDLEVCE